MSFSRILVTGASGFAGSHLTPALRRQFPGAEVIGLGGPSSPQGFDLTDAQSVRSAIAHWRPDAVVHLAGMAAVAQANANPERVLALNYVGTITLLQAVMDEAPDCTVLHVSSGEVYGESLKGGRPTPEDASLLPISAYAISKAMAEHAVVEAVRHGLRVVVARPFNHTGPGQNTSFVVPAFACQIAQIERGEKDPVLQVGALDAIRDFTDVRDVVDGYATFLAHARSLPNGTTFNFASGVARPISDVLDILSSIANVCIETSVDTSRLRPSPVPAMVGDATQAGRVLNWRPRISFEQTLSDVLAEWRRRA